AVAGQNSQHAKQQDDGDGEASRMPGNGVQKSEVAENHHRDEGPQDEDELSLRHQIGLAGLVDQLGNLTHGLVDRKVLQVQINSQSKEQPQEAEDQADKEQVVAGHAQERNRRQVGQL